MDAAPLWTDHERHATSMMNADVFSSTRFKYNSNPTMVRMCLSGDELSLCCQSVQRGSVESVSGDCVRDDRTGL